MILQSVRKESKAPVYCRFLMAKEKNKKNIQNFESPYLANGWCKWNQIFCAAYPTWQSDELLRRDHGTMHV